MLVDVLCMKDHRESQRADVHCVSGDGAQVLHAAMDGFGVAHQDAEFQASFQIRIESGRLAAFFHISSLAGTVGPPLCSMISFD